MNIKQGHCLRILHFAGVRTTVYAGLATTLWMFTSTYGMFLFWIYMFIHYYS